MRLKNVILSILMIMIVCSVSPSVTIFAEEPSSQIWLEGESGKIVSGDYVTVEYANYSGGGALYLNSNEEKVAQVDYKFTIAAEGEYDIKILSTTGSQPYLSTYRWKLDDEEYENCPSSGVEAYKTHDQYSLPIYWYSLKTGTLKPGVHTFSVLVEKKRTMDNVFMYNLIDAIAVVPTAWKWEPTGNIQPYRSDLVKVKFVSGSVDKKLYKRDEIISVKVYNTVEEKTTVSPQIIAELHSDGQMVSSQRVQPHLPMKGWRVGKEYKDTFSLTIPFNVPDGTYDVVTGIVGTEYTDGEAMHKVATICIGKERLTPEKNALEVVKLSLSEKINRHAKTEGSVTFKQNKALDYNANGYLSFWKNDELWHVVELGALETKSFVPDTENVLNFNYTIDADLPDGKYTVKFGLHNYENTGSDFSVSVGGNAITNTKPHKPMANGNYYAKKTGRNHFWYVNQNNALIWDGAPYIPIGGMYCSSYIIYYDINDQAGNKKRWDEEIAILDTLKAGGIVDIYLNTNKPLTLPVWVWNSYCELLDSYGFVYGLQFSNIEYNTVEYYAMRANPGAKTYSKAISESGTYSVEIPLGELVFGVFNSAECAYIIVDNVTNKPIKVGSGKGELTPAGNVRLTADVGTIESGDYTIYFTPKINARSQTVPNVWEHSDGYKQRFEEVTSRLYLGDNMRNFIDPLSNESGLTNPHESARFVSDMHDESFAKWLETKYTTIEAMNDAWKFNTPIASFGVASRLIPLYTTPKDGVNSGVDYLMDRKTNDLYSMDIIKGVMWDDYLTFRDQSILKLNNDAADSLKKYVNVPVVYKHVSYLEDYFINKNTNSKGFDGVGMEVYGKYEILRSNGGFVVAEVEQSPRTMWKIVTETNTDENMVRKTAEGTTYPSKDYMWGHFDTLFNEGVTGLYDFLIYADFFYEAKGYSYSSKPETFDWLRDYRKKMLLPASVNQIANSVKTEKLSYLYPASQTWWFNPNKRQGVIYNNDYVSTRTVQLRNGEMVKQTFDPTVDKKLLFVTLEDNPATLIWGKKFLDYYKNKPSGEKVAFMGLRKDLGSLDVIDKYYTDEFITLEDGNVIQVLNPPKTAKVMFATEDGKPFGIIDGDLYIVSNTGWNTVDSTGQFTSLRYIEEMLGIESKSEALTPTKEITRAGFYSELFRTMKLMLVPYKGCYSDVKPTDWYASVIQTAYDYNLVDINMIVDNNFLPSQPITEIEVKRIEKLLEDLRMSL